MIKRQPKAFKPISLCDLESIERLLSSAYKVFVASETYIRIWNYLSGKRPRTVDMKLEAVSGSPEASITFEAVPPEA